jgi:putative transposase
MGGTVAQRREYCRGLFKAHIDGEELTQIRAAWQTGTPLGNDYFKAKIEAKLKTKVGQARRGRPFKRTLTQISRTKSKNK